MIKIENLHKSFGKLEVLKGIDLQFGAGKISAILGPNGSGKTTLIKTLLGMCIPSQGLIKFNDVSIKGQWDYRRQIGYLPQIARFPDNLTVEELLRMIKDLRGEKADDAQIIERFDLKPFLQKRLGTLSGGTRQKANIVQTFMFDNPVIVLDEPTAGLDPVAMIALKELIQAEKAKGKMILITTHIMNFVEEIADEVVFLLEGKIHYQGGLRQLKEQYQEPNLERAIAKILLGKSVNSGQFSQNGLQVLNPIHSSSKS